MLIAARLIQPLVLTTLCLLGLVSQAAAAPRKVTSAATATPESILPEPRTCFWSLGPVSGSPYINVADPDSGVFYWTAHFSTPGGARLALDARFAHARYQSLISYDQAGRPVEAVADDLIQPQPGSANPCRVGADRSSLRRSYTVEIVPAPPDPARKEGVMRDGATSNTVHATPSPGGVQTLIYCIYGGRPRTRPDGRLRPP